MQAVRVLARSFNCNCSHKWLHMVCKLDDAHLASAEADTEKTLKNFRARLKRAVTKLGGQVAYYEFVSHKDGKSGAEKRLHIHYVIRLEGVHFEDGLWMLGDKALEDIWGMGSVWAEPLYNAADYTDLAAYLLRQSDRSGREKGLQPQPKPEKAHRDGAAGTDLRAIAGPGRVRAGGARKLERPIRGALHTLHRAAEAGGEGAPG